MRGQGASLTVTSGKSDFDATVGVDENGAARNGFSFSSGVKFDVIGSVLRVVPPGENTQSAKVAANAAVDEALKSGYMDRAISVTSAARAGVSVWKVYGTKKLVPVSVYIYMTTGAVAGKE